jgi:hypothetical protein
MPRTGVGPVINLVLITIKKSKFEAFLLPVLAALVAVLLSRIAVHRPDGFALLPPALRNQLGGSQLPEMGQPSPLQSSRYQKWTNTAFRESTSLIFHYMRILYRSCGSQAKWERERDGPA